MRKFLFVLTTLSFFTSCIQIQTSRLTYEKVLSKTAKEKVSFVGDKAHFSLPTPLMRDTLFMANGKQVKEYVGKSEWTVVYRYLPSCGSSQVIRLQEFLEKVKAKQLDYLVVLRNMTSDDYVHAAKIVSMVGMDYEHYGKNSCDNPFLQDLVAEKELLKKHRYNLFLLFHRDTLVGSGNQLDSLLLRFP